MSTAQPDSAVSDTIKRETAARLVFPDVARGVALLGIAMANLPSAWLLLKSPVLKDLAQLNMFGAISEHGLLRLLDQIAVMFSAIFVHNRGLPLFSTLLGFGVGLITVSLWRKNISLSAARAIIARRYMFLAIFGFVHCALLFYGDIMLSYGIIGISMALLLTVSDKILQRIAIITMSISFAFSAVFAVLIGFAGFDSFEDSDTGFSDISAFLSGSFLDISTPLGYYFMNITTAVGNIFSAPIFALMYMPVMLIGFTWARRAVLQNVSQHRRELTIWAALAVLVMLGIGVPWGLALIGVLPAAVGDALVMFNTMAAQVCGPGLLAIFALALNSVQQRLGTHAKPNSSKAKGLMPGALRVFAALGKRSMSGYLLQSVLFYILVLPFTFNLAADLTVSGLLLFSFGVWLITLIAANILEHYNKPGPFEALHRRISYGKNNWRITPRKEQSPASQK